VGEPFARRLRLISACERFRKSDKGLSVFSAPLLEVVFVTPPLAGRGAGPQACRPDGLRLAAAVGRLALAERGVACLVLMPVALATVAVDLASWFVPGPFTPARALALPAAMQTTGCRSDRGRNSDSAS
jgi:hypothetical protein